MLNQYRNGIFLDYYRCLSNDHERLSSFFRSKNIRTVAIYGWGEIGKSIYKQVSDLEIDVPWIMDIHMKIFDDTRFVNNLDSELESVDMIIVTVIDEVDRYRVESSLKEKNIARYVSSCFDIFRYIHCQELLSNEYEIETKIKMYNESMGYQRYAVVCDELYWDSAKKISCKEHSQIYLVQNGDSIAQDEPSSWNYCVICNEDALMVLEKMICSKIQIPVISLRQFLKELEL